MEVVGQAESMETLREAVQSTPADVVVMEAGLITAPATMLPELVRLAPDIKMIVQVLEVDEPTTVELYRRGVRGVIPRSISPDLLLKCVRKIAAGETWIDNRSVSWVIEAYRTNGTAGGQVPTKAQPKLSPKEPSPSSAVYRGACGTARSLTRSARPSRSSRTICARYMTSWASRTAWSLLSTAFSTSWCPRAGQMPLRLPPSARRNHRILWQTLRKQRKNIPNPGQNPFFIK